MSVHLKLQNLSMLLSEDLLYQLHRDGGNFTENTWKVLGKYAICGPIVKMNFLYEF